MLPPGKALFRSGNALHASAGLLDAFWTDLRDHAGADGPAALRSREAAALVAHARWCLRAALARTESRGMHRRTDLPARDPRLAHRLVTAGLDRVEVRKLDGVEARPQQAPAEAA